MLLRKDLTVAWSVDTPTRTHSVVFIHASGSTQFGSRLLLFCWSCICVFSRTKAENCISPSVRSSCRVQMYLEAVEMTSPRVAFEMQMPRYKKQICILFISVRNSAMERQYTICRGDSCDVFSSRVREKWELRVCHLSLCILSSWCIANVTRKCS